MDYFIINKGFSQHYAELLKNAVSFEKNAELDRALLLFEGVGLKKMTDKISSEISMLDKEREYLEDHSRAFLGSFTTEDNNIYHTVYDILREIRMGLRESRAVYNRVYKQINGHYPGPYVIKPDLEIDTSHLFGRKSYNLTLGIYRKSESDAAKELFDRAKEYFGKIGETMALCKDVIYQQDEEFGKNPRVLRVLYQQQYNEIVQSREEIKDALRNNKQMIEEDIISKLKRELPEEVFLIRCYHQFTLSDMIQHVCVQELIKAGCQPIIDIEKQINCKDWDIEDVRYLIDHFDDLPITTRKNTKTGEGAIRAKDIAWFLEKCEIDDKEDFYLHYFVPRYTKNSGKWKLPEYHAIYIANNELTKDPNNEKRDQFVNSMKELVQKRREEEKKNTTYRPAS